MKLFTSDLHLGDSNILVKRKLPIQYSTPEEHHQYMANQILQTVSKSDILYIVGDYVMDKSCLNYAEQIKDSCKKVILILGNHDTENQKLLKEVLRFVDEVHSSLKIGKKYIVTHIPIKGSLLEKSGRTNIHGHLHTKAFGKKYFNVSPDLNLFKPVSKLNIKRG